MKSFEKYYLSSLNLAPLRLGARNFRIPDSGTNHLGEFTCEDFLPPACSCS
jgi:hypothetical protein